MVKFTKIPILNFETYADDQALLDGERLFDEKKIKDLQLVNKGGWEAIILSEPEEKVSVKVFEERIEKINCSCQPKDNKLCKHLICCFHAIRSQSDKPIIREKQNRRITRKRKSSIRDMMDHVKKEEIVDFLSSYASKDKKFSLMIRTHFARKFSELTGNEVYRQILDQAFPAAGENTMSSPAKNIQLLIMVSREMMVHFVDAISLGQLTDAFQMIHALIEKLSYSIHLSNKNTDKAEDILIKAHLNLETLLKEEMAPALREDILDTMIESSGKSFYHYDGPKNLHSLLLNNQLSQEQLGIFLQQIKLKSGQSISLDQKVLFLAVYIRATSQSIEGSLFDPWIFSQLVDKYLMIETIYKLIDLQFAETALSFLNTAKENGKIDQKVYCSTMMKVMEAMGDKSKAAEFAEKCFYLSPDLSLINKLKTLSENNWPGRYKRMIKKLREIKNERSILIALQLCSKEQDHSTLMNILNSQKKLDLFLKFDALLSTYYPEKLKQFYRLYLLDYHKDHVGMHAVNKTRLILDHLRSIGLKKERNEILIEILNHFPERKSLESLKKENPLFNF